jgi:hypothetical protein
VCGERELARVETRGASSTTYSTVEKKERDTQIFTLFSSGCEPVPLPTWLSQQGRFIFRPRRLAWNGRSSQGCRHAHLPRRGRTSSRDDQGRPLFEDRDAAFTTDEDADAPRKTTPIGKFKDLLRRGKSSLIVMRGFSVATSHLTSRVRSIVEEMAQSIAKDNLRYDAPKEDRIREIGSQDASHLCSRQRREDLHALGSSSEGLRYPPAHRSKLRWFRTVRSVADPRAFCFGNEYHRYHLRIRGSEAGESSFEVASFEVVSSRRVSDFDLLLLFFTQVQREKLLIALDRALVNVVNNFGVLINEAVSNSYEAFVLL